MQVGEFLHNLALMQACPVRVLWCI